MNQQFLSILFSALICSTLGHEYLTAKELTYQAKRNVRSNSIGQFRSHNESCPWLCPVPVSNSSIPATDGKYDTHVVFNKEEKVVAVVNVTAAVAIAVDIQASIVVLFNGNTGAAILIDLNTETVLYWSAGSSDKLWLSKDISFVKYFLSLGSLTNVKNFPNSQSFNLKSASKEIVIEIGVIISQLGSHLAERIKINAQVAVSITLVLSTSIVHTLGGPLAILIQKAEATEYVLLDGIVQFVTFLQGFASFASKITGGLEAIIVADIEFKLSLLLAAASGIEVFVALVGQVASKVDLSTALGPILKSPEAFFEAIVSFSSGIYTEVAGLEAIIYNAFLLISKRISISAFVDITIQVAASGKTVSSERFSAVIGSVITVIETQVNSFQSSASWSVILTLFSNIRDDKLNIGGVDISAVSQLIIANSGKLALDLVINILVAFSAVASISVAIATLYMRLMFFIISGQGVTYVLALLPSIKINVDFSSSVSIISQIVKNVSLSSIFQAILSFNIIQVIKSIPVFGDIYAAVSSSCVATGRSTNELNSGLNGAEISKTFFGWIKYTFKMGGGEAPSGGIAGQMIIGGVTSWTVSKSEGASGQGSGGNFWAIHY